MNQLKKKKKHQQKTGEKADLTDKKRTSLVKQGHSSNMLHGISPVLLALQTKKRKFFGLSYKAGKTSEEMAHILSLCRKQGISINEKSYEDITDLAQTTQHQGVVLECSPIVVPDVDNFFANKSEKSLVVFLDQIEDPQNFGAIVRSAAYLGADAVITLKRHAAPLSPVASKASAGALEYFPIYAATNLAKSLELFKKEGYWIYGSTLDGGHFAKQDIAEKSVLIMGNEGKGIRDLTRKNCDHLIKIPGNESTESLNVNAAAAILISHFIFSR